VRPERLLVPIAVRCAVLAVIVLLAALPAYVFVEAPWRPVVLRVGVALVLGVALLQLRAAAAARLAPPASALDEARGRPPAAAAVPLRLQELMDEVRAARRSRRHFEQILWPRLTALAARPLVAPPARRGRGPGLAALGDAITQAERER
jgi:hypothetical protein